MTRTTTRSQASSAAPEPDAQQADVLYKSVVSVRTSEGPDKRVHFQADDAHVTMGMSGGLAGFYGAKPGTYVPHASTLDYVVGAVCACLLGTFRRALLARHIQVPTEDLTAEATGDVIVDDGVPQLKRILVRYRLVAPPDVDAGVIQRAHAVHHRACAVSRSLEAAIDIRTELVLVPSGDF